MIHLIFNHYFTIKCIILKKSSKEKPRKKYLECNDSLVHFIIVNKKEKVNCSTGKLKNFYRIIYFTHKLKNI